MLSPQGIFIMRLRTCYPGTPPPLPLSPVLFPNPGGAGGAFCPRAPVIQWYLWPRYCKITLYSAESM